MNKKIIIIVQIFLIVIIPLLTVGFDAFENTRIYKSIFQFDNLDYTIGVRWSTNYGEHVSFQINRYNEAKEFNAMWNLIKKNTLVKLPDKEPNWIYYSMYENSLYVPWPENWSTPGSSNVKKVRIIPESLPVVVTYNCSAINCPLGEVVYVGTIGDIKNWYNEEQHNIRMGVNLSITFLSIFLGLITIKASKENT